MSYIVGLSYVHIGIRRVTYCGHTNAHTHSHTHTYTLTHRNNLPPVHFDILEGISPVTHKNKSCHVCHNIVTHVRLNCSTHTDELIYTYEYSNIYIYMNICFLAGNDHRDTGDAPPSLDPVIDV